MLVVDRVVLDIREVDPGIGHDEAKAVRDNQHIAALAYDFRRLAQDEFNEARVFVDSAGDLLRPVRRADGPQLYNAAFGLRNNLLCDNNDVTVAEFFPRGAKPSEDYSGKVVLGLDERDTGKRVTRRTESCLVGSLVSGFFVCSHRSRCPL